MLTAAALVGVAQEALTIAVDYAKERTAFGVPIGTFQALSHPMADAAMGIESARRIARKAAWFVEHEPDGADRLAAMALLHASEVATTTAHLAIHVLGGIGFTVEAAPHLYYRKAKGYVLAGGDPQAELQVIAALAYDERRVRAPWRRSAVDFRSIPLDEATAAAWRDMRAYLDEHLDHRGRRPRVAHRRPPQPAGARHAGGTRAGSLPRGPRMRAGWAWTRSWAPSSKRSSTSATCPA